MAFQQYPQSDGGSEPGGYGNMPHGAQLQQWRRGHMAGQKLASWPWRMASGLIDYVPLWIILSIFLSVHVAVLGFIIAAAVLLVNNVYMQGMTGQSLGKRLVGTRVVSAVDAGPTTFTYVYPGVGRCFGRQLAHILDVLPFYTGYIRPLWQAQYRCWSDTVSKTVVLAREDANIPIEQRQQGAKTIDAL